MRKAVLKISQYLQENICVGVPFNKVAGLQGCNFIKKRLEYRCFPVNIANFLRTAILKNMCLIRERLVLNLTEFLEQQVFKEAIFQNSLSNIFISNSYFTFNLLT